MLGVLGLLCDPSFFVGVPGTGAKFDLGLNNEVLFGRASAESGALYFLWVELNNIGVLTRESRAASCFSVVLVEFDVEDELDCAESGRLGVNGVGRTALEAEGVFGTTLLRFKDITGVWISWKIVWKIAGAVLLVLGALLILEKAVFDGQVNLNRGKLLRSRGRDDSRGREFRPWWN